ncbi:phenylalanyl-tRNA synthetase alpha chain [Mycoplasmoides fastidiosum]|uniref:phenylalanine--tRNA ligase n=1 Tax=Mycoplasmoides fastidiosum TaxID=92758 RepID=A0ABU0LYU0_9BACT|nr:phenylalanine--tRNA ligase subunit alpha [Mycoplasmoides fastidiosum]MDQ0513871.1 phenylalanyl-tRNA synthetase alpha chain [Mycoplasmoides fastidiosum]UUD37715.1 phenylalanine--tRNA ligase subunit alpha [Mycoplasmoides fastidiosum]
MNAELLEQLLGELKTKLTQAPNLQAAIEAKNLWLKNHVLSLQANLRNLTPEEKKVIGGLINQLKDESKLLFDEVRDQFERQNFTVIKADLSIKNEAITAALPHWVNEIIARSCEWFARMNFQIETGSDVVSYQENFDLLNIGPNHPARLNSDSFYFDDKTMLRTHNTAHTAKVLLEQKNKGELRVVTFGDVYRNDPDDFTHTHQFTQIDFIWVQEKLSLANLKWMIKNFLDYVFERDINLRFRPSFFPFTEPSFEIDMACNKCEQQGCSTCKKTGWIEVLGSGMINQHVLRNTGYDPTKFKAIAAGVGIERLAMIKYSISDIRNFFNNDVRFLSEVKKC